MGSLFEGIFLDYSMTDDVLFYRKSFKRVCKEGNMVLVLLLFCVWP